MIRKHEASNFLDLATNIVARAEGYGEIIYRDTKKVPTIGHGLALVYYKWVSGKRVFYEAPDWKNKFNDASVSFSWTSADQTRLDKIVDKLNGKTVAETWDQLLPKIDGTAT